MKEQELCEWKISCKKEISAQIILNQLKKKKMLKRKKIKEIQKKINLISYKNFLSSPHLEGKEELKKKAIVLCFNSYLSSIGFTK